MKALGFVIMIFAAASGAKWGLEEFNVFEAWDPGSEEHVRTAFGNEIHSLLKRTSRWSLVLACWTILDALWLPWLQIEAVVMGWGIWQNVSQVVRAAVAFGWFVALSAFLLSFSLGI